MGQFFPKLLIAVGAWALIPTVLLAMGFTLPAHQLKQYGDDAIHGYDVNGEVVVFFQGDTARLNEYLRDVSKARYGIRNVILQVGPVFARSPWDKEGAKEKRQADWSSEITRPKTDGSDITVHVWLGRNVQVADVKIPANFVVDSGKEIDDIISRREQTNRLQGAATASPKSMLAYLKSGLGVAVQSVDGTASVKLFVYSDEDYATATTIARLGRSRRYAVEVAKTDPVIQKALDAYIKRTNAKEISTERIYIVPPLRTSFGRVAAVGDDYVLVELEDSIKTDAKKPIHRRRIIPKWSIGSIDIDANPAGFITAPPRARE